MDSSKWNVNLVESHTMSEKVGRCSYQYENGSLLWKHPGDNRLHPITNRQWVRRIEGNGRARSDDLAMCLKYVEFVLNQ